MTQVPKKTRLRALVALAVVWRGSRGVSLSLSSNLSRGRARGRRDEIASIRSDPPRLHSSNQVLEAVALAVVWRGSQGVRLRLSLDLSRGRGGGSCGDIASTRSDGA